MADGKTHAAAAKQMAGVVTVVAAVAAVAIHPVMIAPVVGAWCAVVVDPDLDHHVHTESEAVIFRYNRLLGRLWSLYWWPYEWMSAHRGRSHTIPQGTLDRFVLLFWPVLLLSVGLVPTWGAWVVAWWLLVFVGQCVVDAVHLRLDGLI